MKLEKQTKSLLASGSQCFNIYEGNLKMKEDYTIKNTDYTNRIFKNHNFTNVHFVNCDLTNATFVNCKFDNTKFIDCKTLDGTYSNCTGCFDTINNNKYTQELVH